jgi:hypothetical protein
MVCVTQRSVTKAVANLSGTARRGGGSCVTGSPQSEAIVVLSIRTGWLIMTHLFWWHHQQHLSAHWLSPTEGGLRL